MKKRVVIIAGVVSTALALSDCATNPYTSESEADKFGVGAGFGAVVGMLSSSKNVMVK